MIVKLVSIVFANGDDESDLIVWSLLLLAATVWSFVHLLLSFQSQHKQILITFMLLQMPLAKTCQVGNCFDNAG